MKQKDKKKEEWVTILDGEDSHDLWQVSKNKEE